MVTKTETGYREEWVAEILGGRSVLQLALDVHMTANGSAERSRDDQQRDINALVRVVETWRNYGVCRFDDAVLAVLVASLSELG